MSRSMSLAPHLTTTDLAQRYRQSDHLVERSHWQMIWLVSQGHSGVEVARLTGYSATWVRAVIHRYNAGGPDGVRDRRRTSPGQPALVSAAVREALRERLLDPPPDGGLWTSPKVAVWLSDRVGRSISTQRAWETMRRIGFSMQQPRPGHPAADPVAQAAFKKGAR